MRVETLGLWITAAEEAVLEALAFMASLELLAGRDASRSEGGGSKS